MQKVKLSKIKPGDKLIADGGFTCMKENDVKTVFKASDDPVYGGLFICCSHDRHYLSGQLDSEGFLVGLYEANSSI